MTPHQRMQLKTMIAGDSWAVGNINGGAADGWVTRGMFDKALCRIEISNVGGGPGVVSGLTLQRRKKLADGTYGAAGAMKQKNGTTDLTLPNMNAVGSVTFTLFLNEVDCGPDDQFRIIGAVGTNAVKLSAHCVLCDASFYPVPGAPANALAAVHGPESREPVAKYNAS